MTPERYARVCELFLELLRVPAEDRASKLERSCAGDAGLVDEVRSLLAEHERFVQAPPSPPSSAAATGAVLGPGERIAGYRIVGVLGTGGMGVVHRDLKPANIIVEEPDLPKVLDLGIALSTDRDLGLTTQTTEGAVLGTLAYMSPEQLAGDRAAVDARTDVYALGVLAYELLAGRPPTDIRGRPFAQALLALTIGEPPSLGRVNRRLKGDLETIVAKAMEKQPSRRYATAGELSDDLDRYLHAEPVRARPTTTLYRISRFTRRNRVLVSAIGIVFTALLAGLWSTSWQAARATAEKKRTLGALVTAKEATSRAEAAEKRATERADQYQTSSRFIEDMFASVDPDEQGREARVVDVLDQASRVLAAGPARLTSRRRSS